MTPSLLILVGLMAQDAQRAAERARMAETMTYRAAVIERAQHREVVRVQPASELSPTEVRANRAAELQVLRVPEVGHNGVENSGAGHVRR